MVPNPVIQFDNTEHAFAYKSDEDLKKAHFLFRTMGIGPLVNLGIKLTPWAMRLGLPVKGLIRNTIFRQFVGGETLEQTANAANRLADFGVKTILDYGVEGKEGEENFDHATEEFLRVIRYAASQKSMPFMSVKVTGIARFGLLEKLDAAAKEKSGYMGLVHTGRLNADEREEWKRVEARMERIVSLASALGTGVLIDAEDSWIQDPVDALTMQMMERYNQEKVVIFNTVQLYRHDRLEFLKQSHRESKEKGFLLGMKIVRGAYMEKERARAAEMNYPSPIQPDKESTDADYNEALRYCIDHLAEISVIIASHNEDSNMLGARLLHDKGLAHDHPHVHFSQLYGMSDHITFNLAKAGYSVSKYLPFGPINDVIPYLMRRAAENSSVSGQTSRELSLISREMKRRGI